MINQLTKERHGNPYRRFAVNSLRMARATCRFAQSYSGGYVFRVRCYFHWGSTSMPSCGYWSDILEEGGGRPFFSFVSNIEIWWVTDVETFGL